MRIHSIEMAGFGPFLVPQRVDFDAFAEDGIFLIQGRTGAGKSSILDGVVYALYNSAPRYRSGAATQLRSHHCSADDATWVQLEFSTDDCRYRVRRSPEYERPRSRGEGTTTERPTAHLWRLDGGEWTALEAGVRPVAQALDEILPLSCQQFLQVVLLAQGEFARFLVADSAERKALLGALFDTKRFETLDHLLQERVSRRRAAMERAASANATLVEALALHLRVDAPAEPDEEWLGGLHDMTAAEAVEAEDTRAAARRQMEEVRTEWERLRAVLTLQERRASLRRTLEQLEEERESIARLREVCERAVAAQSVRPAVEARARQATRLREAQVELTKAEAGYEELCGAAVPDDLPGVRDALVAEVDAARRALEVEARLVATRSQVAEAEAELVRRRSEVEAIDTELGALRQVLEREVTTSVEKASAAVHELVDELTRARRHATATEASALAEQRLIEAGESRTRASAALDELRRLSFQQYAGRLAETLVVGEACPVCGGVEHPSPAPRSGAPVQDEDVEEAERAFDEAQQAYEAAKATRAAARATEEAYAGARTVEVLSDRVEEATGLLREAERDERERRDAADAVTTLSERRQQCAEAAAGLVVRVQALGETIDDLVQRVESARSGSDSVADRLDGLRAHLTALDAVTVSRHDQARAHDDHLAATEHLGEALEQHGFTDEQECLAAARPAEEVERLVRRVRRHDEAWTVTTTGLADEALAALPDVLVDPAPLEARVREAAADHDAAAAAAGVAAQRHETTADLVRRVRAAWSRGAAERREFEVLRRLAASVHGEQPNTRRLRLESYVLAVELEQIVLAANRRLQVMSDGRYALLLDDRVATRGNNSGLGVRVLDHHTQEPRTPESLSGGEKFLASLSLALGLSEVVTNRAGGVSLDTLFIDEGFGSLDGETLDLAMHTLDSLREHGRTVGVISHVEVMRERIPAQLHVEHAPGGWSTIRALA